MFHGPFDGPPDGLPSKACPLATMRQDELDLGRQKLDGRVIRRRSADASHGEIVHTRRARYSEITRMKGDRTPDKQECMPH
jgi:hypothetical protein